MVNILQALRLEWFKFRKNKVVMFCLVTLLILLPGIGSVMLSVNLDLGMINSDSFLRFPEVWRWLAFISNWIVFFLLGFVFIYVVAVEYNFKTMRQSILNGLTRTQLFFHKFYFILLISIAYTIYYTIVCVAFGSFLTEGEYAITENSIHVLYVFLVCLGYGSLGMFLSMVFKKTSISLILYFIYGMFLENVIRHLIHKNIVYNKSMHYYPVNVLEDLTPLPLPDYLSETVQSNLSGADPIPLVLSQNEAMIGSIVYILIFFIASYLIMKKSDL